MSEQNPLIIFKEKQKNLADKIRKDHDDWDSVTYRHQHVAYCELRGRKRKEIEIPGEHNEPNENWIDKIKKELQEKINEWRAE